MNYRELIERDGGFSVSVVDGTAPTSGYMVSRAGGTRRFLIEDFDNWCLEDFLSSIHPVRPANVYVGGWLHDGEVWLDLSENVQDLTEARRLGVERNQIAIFDVVNGCEVPTGGDGS